MTPERVGILWRCVSCNYLHRLCHSKFFAKSYFEGKIYVVKKIMARGVVYTVQEENNPTGRERTVHVSLDNPDLRADRFPKQLTNKFDFLKFVNLLTFAHFVLIH